MKRPILMSVIGLLLVGNVLAETFVVKKKPKKESTSKLREECVTILVDITDIQNACIEKGAKVQKKSMCMVRSNVEDARDGFLVDADTRDRLKAVKEKSKQLCEELERMERELNALDICT